MVYNNEHSQIFHFKFYYYLVSCDIGLHFKILYDTCVIQDRMDILYDHSAVMCAYIKMLQRPYFQIPDLLQIFYHSHMYKF